MIGTFFFTAAFGGVSVTDNPSVVSAGFPRPRLAVLSVDKTSLRLTKTIAHAKQFAWAFRLFFQFMWVMVWTGLVTAAFGDCFRAFHHQ